jgi:hypothetical protein
MSYESDTAPMGPVQLESENSQKYPKASTFKVLSNSEWECFEKLIPKKKSILGKIVGFIKREQP